MSACKPSLIWTFAAHQYSLYYAVFLQADTEGLADAQGNLGLY